MMPSSPGMMVAALTSSLQPSNLETSTGFLVELNLSSLLPGRGFINAAMIADHVMTVMPTKLDFCEL